MIPSMLGKVLHLAINNWHAVAEGILLLADCRQILKHVNGADLFEKVGRLAESASHADARKRIAARIDRLMREVQLAFPRDVPFAVAKTSQEGGTSVPPRS